MVQDLVFLDCEKTFRDRGSVARCLKLRYYVVVRDLEITLLASDIKQ